MTPSQPYGKADRDNAGRRAWIDILDLGVCREEREITGPVPSANRGHGPGFATLP
jgi:hypothetical protein